MKQLNEEAYRMEPNPLIYDFHRPIDAKNIVIRLTAGKEGVLKRGQLIDFANDTYTPHTEGGLANCLISDDVSYAVTDTEVVASVYISGNFRANKVITDVELTETDADNLRIHGICLK